ncbi:DUF418 domain-containing protein [Cohnella hongkongensis]|uniref:DUF418 domain-containing protein n=1 Tax=Cohnella hongkongensis TaxID=178337 RepID=A0ABV9F8R4_9BACL
MRFAQLDWIRGLALLGIAIANMPLYSSPYLYMNMLDAEWWAATGDRIAKLLIYIFVDYKFISMFSFLFGAGFIIFLQRAEQKGRRGTALYLRRLFVLLLIGLLHGYFIWFGDILLVYAMLGFALLAFYRRKPNTLLYWSLGLLLIPAAWIALHTFAPGIVRWGLPEGPSTVDALRLIRDANEIYSSGTLEEMFRQRLLDLSHVQNSSLLTIPLTFAMFLLGAYAWRKGWLRNPDLHAVAIRKIGLWSGCIGLLFLAFQVWLHHTVDAGQSGFNNAHWAGILIAGPAVSVFYMASLLLLSRRRFWRLLLAPLQDAGRMALTNYLLQSVVCTFLFYSYGLGWYGQVAPSYGIALSLLLFAAQVWGSRLWLRRYRFGPVEWLWRSLTYGKRQPMKHQT